MAQVTRLVVIPLVLSLACQAPTRDSAVPAQETDTVAQGDPPAQETENLASRLASGTYGGGLKLAIDENTVSGYYEEASGWNEQIDAPQFSCAYVFSGRYQGSDTVPITLQGYAGVSGRLEILSEESIRVTLPLNPCHNEEPTVDTWKLETPYPLVAIKEITVSQSNFYSAPGEGKRSAYLIRGDRAEIIDTKDGWYQVRYSGAKATTEGWMPSSSFEAPLSERLSGSWLSAKGEPYEVYFRFYSDLRYKTWTINTPEPQGMTGSFTVKPDVLALEPCGKSAVEMPVRFDSGGLSLMIPGTDQWTTFEQYSGKLHVETPGFSIEQRSIITFVNNRRISIPSATTKQAFLDAVCPFEVTPDAISLHEGAFDILRVRTVENDPLFYAVVDGDEVTALVIESPLVNRQGISIGSTFAELRQVIPAVTLSRSEMDGSITGANEHFSFSFGYIEDQLFDAGSGTIPDTARIMRITL